MLTCSIWDATGIRKLKKYFIKQNIKVLWSGLSSWCEIKRRTRRLWLDSTINGLGLENKKIKELMFSKNFKKNESAPQIFI
jgi:hypothetical protein